MKFSLRYFTAAVFCLIALLQFRNHRQELAAHLFTPQSKPSDALQALLTFFNIEQQSPLAIERETQKMWLDSVICRGVLEHVFEQYPDFLLPLFRKLSLIDAVYPQSQQFDYIIILGSQAPHMERRISFLCQLQQHGVRADHIVLISGTRPLAACEKYRGMNAFINVPETESELMKELCFIYEVEDIFSRSTCTFLCACPSAAGQKVSLDEKILCWLARNPTPGNCLIIADQPRIGYQESAFKTIMPALFTIEMAGPAISPTTTAHDIFDALARWIYQENRRHKWK